jgi:DNA-binding transcriptional LysR family regulator
VAARSARAPLWPSALARRASSSSADVALDGALEKTRGASSAAPAGGHHVRRDEGGPAARRRPPRARARRSDRRRRPAARRPRAAPPPLLHRMESSDSRPLVSLDALLQEGSVTGAARRVGLSTPAMSHALARIRERLGDPILVRSGRGMLLTPRALALKAQVHDVVTEARRALEPERPSSRASCRAPSSCTRRTTSSTILGLAVDRILRDEAPKVCVRFVPNTPDDPASLRDQGSDLAVGIYGELPQEMRSRQLLTDRFVCVVRKGHPAGAKRFTLEQFVGLPHLQVAPRGKPGGYLDDVLRERGLTRTVARAVPYFVTALQLVAQTDYVLTISERIAKRFAERALARAARGPGEAAALRAQPRLAPARRRRRRGTGSSATCSCARRRRRRPSATNSRARASTRPTRPPARRGSVVDALIVAPDATTSSSSCVACIGGGLDSRSREDGHVLATRRSHDMSLRDPNPSNKSKPKRVAIVIANPATSSTTGWPVGFWWSELTHPYYAFTRPATRSSLQPRGRQVRGRRP